jgi:hypothetical protein
LVEEQPFHTAGLFKSVGSLQIAWDQVFSEEKYCKSSRLVKPPFNMSALKTVKITRSVFTLGYGRKLSLIEAL